MVTCALQIAATFHVKTRSRVQSVSDATKAFAPKFATQIITVYLARFVMNAVLAKQAVHQKLIVHQLRYAKMENVNAVEDSLARHLDAPTLMNVLSGLVTKQLSVKIRQGHLDVFALSKPLAIHTEHRDVYCPINVLAMKIVPRTWHVLKENAQNLVVLLNVDATHYVNLVITKHFAIVHLAI